MDLARDPFFSSVSMYFEVSGSTKPAHVVYPNPLVLLRLLSFPPGSHTSQEVWCPPHLIFLGGTIFISIKLGGGNIFIFLHRLTQLFFFFILLVIQVQSQSVCPGQTTVGVGWSGHDSLTSQDLSVIYIHHPSMFTSTYPLEKVHTVLPSWLSFILQAFPVQSQLVGPGQTTVGVGWSGHGSLTSQDL
jgi:hypothetical protein